MKNSYLIRPFIFAALLISVTIFFACSKREEPKKDDFLNTTKTEEPASRIKIIEGNSFKYFWIVEVDGHQYLVNAAHGGMVHLESCPCKKIVK